MRKGRMRFCFELAILIWQTLQHHEEEEDRLNDDAFGRVRQGCKVVCWQRSRSGRRGVKGASLKFRCPPSGS